MPETLSEQEANRNNPNNGTGMTGIAEDFIPLIVVTSISAAPPEQWSSLRYVTYDLDSTERSLTYYMEQGASSVEEGSNQY